MLKLEFSNECGEAIEKTAFEKLTKKFNKILKERIEKKLQKSTGLIDLVLINDTDMAQMNQEYRSKTGPTDVISFAYLEVTENKKKKGNVIAGDIFISVDTAKRQAKEKKHSLEREMDILFTHGLLHCLGFDHKNDRQEKEMEKWAKLVLES